ncbi:DNA/RNA non-specific endonuclease [Aetokthonos hydrillicola Thurmond2011]|jgi:endonuclease G|uniref:Endonuclease n=1 Tax=Aetokthonos hydrillicola Thurmond2011 TaxID=2712845 RepID=A0AAP5I4X2_9CYAN|nr:DNA/RNA non-specific endonuclease [Aetokthonos hydrillicola]MBO3463774.1 DNA/RNA non-specific endonuclease [Aetokthonos hydrillicola CCALA 1050]MBW4585929.1 DNA/RNA non-specific endonuclease [Aetokthonos hydrillicola CCALA 1050]MDR9893844.1 DNA/RNA non-specific endonuclease [Aetokthonos hydrillicola Thurmond2011]
MFKSFSKKPLRRFILLLTVGLVIVSAIIFGSLRKATAASVHLTMGNPSGAITSTASPDNYLLDKAQYAVSYSNSRRIPNWVSWQLNQSWLGSTPRQNDFRADTTLPSGWYQVTTSDYTGSGYDRGHMCPSADRTNSVTNNSATFLMTNIVPQAADNNQGYWAELENYERSLVTNNGKELYVIAGGYGSLGTIANGKITIPARLFKIIVVTNPGTGAAGVNTSTRVIAIDTPNTQGSRSVNWGNFRTTVDSIESKTGYDFLSNVSSSVQAVIESTVDTGPTQ